MKRFWIALAIGGCVLAAMSPAGAKTKNVSATATVADGATMADGQAAATSAGQAACAQTKGAKVARVAVTAGAVVATFSVECTAAPAAAAKAPAGPIFTQSGTGTATTASFKVPSTWDLQWSYDCSTVFGGTGNFIVTIMDDYGQDSQLDLDNQGINQLSAGATGVEHYHSGGNTKFLKIVALCPWTVTVVKP